jgi:hypothetical protein
MSSTVAEIHATDVWHYMTMKDSVVKGITNMPDKMVRRLDYRSQTLLHKRYHALRKVNPGQAIPATQDELWAALMAHRDSLRAGTLELSTRAGTPITPAELDARLDAGETIADVLNSIVDLANASKA